MIRTAIYRTMETGKRRLQTCAIISLNLVSVFFSVQWRGTSVFMCE